MGLLKHLLFWPVTGPGALVRFSIRQVDAAARRELTDDEQVKEELLELQLLLELGEIDEPEYLEREARLMDELREVRRRREELGMESSWGPVQVSRGGASEEGGSPPPTPLEGEDRPG